MRGFRLFFTVICSAVIASGALVDTCQTQSLAAYEASSSPACLQGLFEYSGFILNLATVPDPKLTRSDVAEAITVTPNGAGFYFSSPLFKVGAGQNANFAIHYEYFIDPAPIVVGAELSLDPPFGDVVVVQTYGLPDPCPAAAVSLTVTPTNPDNAKSFGCAVFQGTVDTNIALRGPAGFDRTGGRLQFDTGGGTTNVPEPSTAILACAGLSIFLLNRKALAPQ